MQRPPHALAIFVVLVFALVASPSLGDDADRGDANPLIEELGRNAVRVRSAAFPLRAGGTAAGQALGERLDRLGYERVRGRRPERPGEYFWGFERFWIYRREHRLAGRDYDARLFALDLERDSGRILGAHDADGEPLSMDRLWIEPELLAESLDADRAERRATRLAELPEHVWRPVLAAEDGRFFDHVGLDGRSVARALLANAKAGGVAQGGSTITQQLIKNRSLDSRRTLGRKASEAVRALALEAAHDKRDILEAYLDDLYLGHVDGLAIHGLATAARVYFSKDADDLSLAESAALAAMIQSPNRMRPTDHAERLRDRRDWVLGRMAELGWASDAEVERASRTPVRARPSKPAPPLANSAIGWIRAVGEDEAGKRLRRGRGVVVETTLDPLLQAIAEDEAAAWLRTLARRGHRDARVALVALDASTGDVLAHVGADPRQRGGFDRARSARRQPGSAIKPLVLLEAFDDCGRRDPAYPARHILDAPVTVDLPSGPWRPANSDGRHRGIVTVRDALRDSLNVPFVRLSRWCGEASMARTLRRAGLDLPSPVPPSFVLGAVETSPVELAGAYSAIAGLGRRVRPRIARRIEKPGGWPIERFGEGSRQVVEPASAFLVHDLLRDVARQGTAEVADIAGLPVAAKTGTSSNQRDAWLAGYVGNLVVVVWVGRDDDRPLGLGGSTGAAPLWRAFVERAAPAWPWRAIERPRGIVTRHIDPTTGLRVVRLHPRAEPELFRRGALPPRDSWFREDEPVDVIR